MDNSFFVTGTDTGIGKTFVTCVLMNYINSKQKKVIGMKPIAAGVDKVNGQVANEDVLLLKKECNFQLNLDEINSYSFPEPIAPHIAAIKNNIDIDFDNIKIHAQNLKKRTDFLFIEGAGGYLVPLNEKETIADLVDVLNIPVILVVGIKLGCINHSLLTVEAILSRGQKLFGWIANIVDKDMLVADENISSLKQRIKQPLIGTIPYSPDKKLDDLKNYISWPDIL